MVSGAARSDSRRCRWRCQVEQHLVPHQRLENANMSCNIVGLDDDQPEMTSECTTESTLLPRSKGQNDLTCWHAQNKARLLPSSPTKVFGNSWQAGGDSPLN